MPFGPGKKFNINLSATTPSQFTTDTLKTQLSAVGLNCSQLTNQFLENSITTVNSQLPTGAVQSFGIMAPQTSPALAKSLASRKLATDRTLFAVPQSILAQAATANWEPGTQAEGFNTYLAVIAYTDHFQWLYNNRGTNGFTGVIDSPAATSGNYPNAQAIQDLFVQVCLTASATVVKGLDQSTMKAILTNVISPLQNESLSDFNQSDSRTIMLVDNYNAQTGEADAVGVLWVNWTLTISDYKRKSKDGGDTHATTLTVQSGSVAYTDPTQLCADYASVCTQFKIPAQPCPPS